MKSPLLEEMGGKIADMLCICVHPDQTHMPFEMVEATTLRCAQALSLEMIAISLTIGAGALLLVWLGVSAPKLPQSPTRGRVIVTRYIPSNELTEEIE